jgi:hypothetical protein
MHAIGGDVEVRDETSPDIPRTPRPEKDLVAGLFGFPPLAGAPFDDENSLQHRDNAQIVIARRA